MSEMAELFDVFFNGRPASKRKDSVTVADLIKRGKGHVMVGGKIYRFELKDVTEKVTRIA
jgi:hypothetical protein